jgi:protein-disulfide isomerase
MPLHRRSLLALAPALALAPTLAPVGARAAEADPRLSERSIGRPDAPVTVMEFFSLTCPHCARFSRDVLPHIQKELIVPGKVRMVFHDYPLDQLALTAAMVARALPPERYEPFAAALFASQDRWAFARDVNSTEELAKMAALAGMSRQTFDATIKDDALRNAILQAQASDTNTYHIDSTPTFIFNGPKAKDSRHAGEMSFDEFARMVSEAAGVS